MATRFVLSCAARTGSTMLQFMLGSHPQVIMHGEVFHRDQIGPLGGDWDDRRSADPTLDEWLWERRTSDLGTFLDQVIFDAQGKAAVGFKFKTDEAFKEAWRDVATTIADDRSIAVIHLRRRDLLAQYVSHQAVLRAGGPMMNTEETGSAPIEPLTIDIGAAVKYAHDVRCRDTLAHQLYAGHRSLDLEYESLDTDAACRFLGVEVMPLTTSTQRLISSHREVAVNYDEAFEAMRTYGPR